MTATARRAARERQRRCRQRRLDGKAVYLVAINGDVLTMLCRLGWLPDADSADPQKVSDAISRLLAASARD